jgi:4-oxalomesaconate tautomerase
MVGEKNMVGNNMIKKIPYLHIRGGSSKGLYFNASDLPFDKKERNEILLKAMEGTTQGDYRQIDGLGGGSSLSSKVAVISRSSHPDADLDYDFVQVVQGKGMVSDAQTCGNILSGVLHLAIHTGMIEATTPTTSAKVRMVNTGGICEIILQTPDGNIATKGDAKVDGVVGTSAPVVCNYLDTAGAACGAMFPTGRQIDEINNVKVTCIDNGMPVVIMLASDLGLTGHESNDELNNNIQIKKIIEDIRLQAGVIMNLGDVTNKTVPKMCLISPPQNYGDVSTRMFIPHVVHEAIGVLAAVSVATAGLYDSVFSGFGYKPDPTENEVNGFGYKPKSTKEVQVVIEHPTGDFTVNLLYEKIGSEIKVLKSGVIRTARILSEGVVFIEE